MAAAESVSPAFSGSPATSSRSMSPASFDASQASYANIGTFQPGPAPSSVRKSKDIKDGKKGLNP